MASTPQSVVDACSLALDEAADFAGLPKPSVQITALNAKVASLTTELNAAVACIDSMKVAAQADVAADAANQAGQGVLDAAAAKGF